MRWYAVADGAGGGTTLVPVALPCPCIYYWFVDLPHTYASPYAHLVVIVGERFHLHLMPILL